MALLLINAAKLQNINFRIALHAYSQQPACHSQYIVWLRHGWSPFESMHKHKFFSSSSCTERIWGAPRPLYNGTRARHPEREIEHSRADAEVRNALRFTSRPLIRVSVFRQWCPGDCTLPSIRLAESTTREMIKHLSISETVQLTNATISTQFVGT